jgi:hypothetical protein
MAKNQEFREELYAQIEKQFDGDFNVVHDSLFLVRTLDNATIGSKMNAAVKTVDTNADVFTANNAFKSIDNDDYYPQIYIHEYEAHKLAGRLAPPYNTKIPVYNIDNSSIKFNLSLLKRL